MSWPTTFANLAAGNQPLSLFDVMFNQVAQMVAIPCQAVGTNAITLSPLGTAPTIGNYQNFSSFRFSAANSSTGAVTAQFGSLGFLPVYLADGKTQAGTGTIFATQEYVLVFIQALNSGGGGFILEQAAVPATVPTAGGSFANLVITNAPGTPNTQVNLSYDECVMNAPGGAPIRFTSQAFTINAATVGANGID